MATNNAVNSVPVVTGTAHQIAVSASSTAPVISLPADVTNSSQTCFSASLSANASNVTGDGTVYTILFDTVAINQGTHYVAGTGTFTAPVTGNYIFNTTTKISGGATNVLNYKIELVLTSSTYTIYYSTASVVATVILTLSGSVIVPMAAGNTAKINLTGNQTAATKQISVIGAASPDTFFSGYLLC